MMAPATSHSSINISPTHISAARKMAQETGKPIIEVLEQQLAFTPSEFVNALAQTLHYAPLTKNDLCLMTPAFDLLPFKSALKKKCIAFANHAGNPTFVIGDPFNDDLIAWAQEYFKTAVNWSLAHRLDIDAYLIHHEESIHAMDSVIVSDESTAASRTNIENLSIQTISESTSPAVKIVHSTLYDALKLEASDIHLETAHAGMSIKYRIDGVLSTISSIHGLELAEQVISRVKVMSELDIAERRIPQDGRFKISTHGREIDIRVSIMPSIFGEDAVLRILDKQMLSDQIKGLRLDFLGFESSTMQVLRKLAAEPYGMILVTGPTGSGKTTTLYAAVNEINRGHEKIITIEDPVEYQLPGVLQIPVNEKKGLTFARGLRSILRHDPDKIMVGEIRDTETAQIAIQSALTGHLVFTTVHANNVFDVIGRFVHMGVSPSNFVSAINGIVAQRLVRQNCPHCTQPHIPDRELLTASGITPESYASFKFYAGRGCSHCRGTGYRGRKAIAEILSFNDEIRELIASDKPTRTIRLAAQRNGTRFLRENALELVRQGVTTLQEINRVTLVA